VLTVTDEMREDPLRLVEAVRGAIRGRSAA
jgi:hypothetical protein